MLSYTPVPPPQQKQQDKRVCTPFLGTAPHGSCLITMETPAGPLHHTAMCTKSPGDTGDISINKHSQSIEARTPELHGGDSLTPTGPGGRQPVDGGVGSALPLKENLVRSSSRQKSKGAGSNISVLKGKTPTDNSIQTLFPHERACTPEPTSGPHTESSPGPMECGDGPQSADVWAACSPVSCPPAPQHLTLLFGGP